MTIDSNDFDCTCFALDWLVPLIDVQPKGAEGCQQSTPLAQPWLCALSVVILSIPPGDGVDVNYVVEYLSQSDRRKGPTLDPSLYLLIDHGLHIEEVTLTYVNV